MALPSGYTPREYIESTGSQYVDTGFKPNQDTRVVMDAQGTSTENTNRWLFGSRTSTTVAVFMLFWSGVTDVDTWMAQYSTSSNSLTFSTSIAALDRVSVDFNKNLCAINGETRTASAATFQGSHAITLFAINTAGAIAGLFKGKLYSCKIYDNGTLVRHFLPCTNPSGEVGLYDDVNGEFYGDAAGVGFVAGPVAIYTELEYIESTGTQYVDTGIADPIKFVADIQFTSTGARALMGYESEAGQYFGINANDFLELGPSVISTVSGTKRNTVTFEVGSSTTTLTANGVTISRARTAAIDTSFKIFGGLADYACPGKIFSGEIYVGGTLVRDYIPVQRLDGAVGLLDQVNNAFYPDAAGGNFIAGPLAAKPEAPASLELIGTTRNAAILAWPGASVGQSYRLYRDGVVVYEGSALCYTDAGLAAGSAHVYSVHTLIGSTESEGVTTEATTTEGIVLITDRTAADVSAGRRKGYYNALDLIRVGEAMAYLEDRFAAVGISVTVSPKLDWQLADIPTHAQALRYLTDIGVLRGKLTEFRDPVSLPGSLTALTWGSANDIEIILLDAEKLIRDIILSYRHYSGRTISGVNALP